MRRATSSHLNFEGLFWNKSDEVVCSKSLGVWTAYEAAPPRSRWPGTEPGHPRTIEVCSTALRMGVPQALPPGLILRGAVSVQPGAFEKLASIASHVRPLVESGAVRGFFLGDEQCGNS